MADSWTGKSQATSTGYKIFIWFIKHAGISHAYRLLGIVAFYYLFFASKANYALVNYFKYSGKPDYKNWRYRYSSFVNFGRAIIDKMAMYLIPDKTPLTFDFKNEIFLHQLAASKKGGLLLGAHIGNWEVAGHLLQRIDAPIYIVMLENEEQAIRQLMDNISGHKQFRVIPLSQDVTFVLKIKEAFDEGGLVCMHADRFVEGMRTLDTSFLGQSAKFPFGPFFIGSKLRTPVTFVYACKESKYHYQFSCTEPKVTSEINQLLVDYVSVMEDKAKAYPYQWYNFYDFWA